MELMLIIILSVVIGVPLGDWYHEKREAWERYKREAWGE